MRSPLKLLFASVVSLTGLTLMVACSPAVEPGAHVNCKKDPKNAACRGTSASVASSASAVTATTATPPTGTVPVTQPPADAGAPRSDPGRSMPDGGKPQVPPANHACADLGRCCQKVQSSIERAACMAVVYSAKPSTCATAVIGYQFLGCGHAPLSFGSPGSNTDDDDGDGTPDFVDPDSEADVTLEDYCMQYPTDEACDGGWSEYDNDPCLTNPSSFECSEDPFGPGDDFGDPDPTDPDPPDPYDPYDPYDPGDPYDPYDPGDGDPWFGE